MAFAPHNVKTSGQFREKTYDHVFEYSLNPELVLHPKATGGKNVVFPHLVYVGALKETRMALVLGNVVHIVTDETEHSYVIQKWFIKNHRKW